MIHVIHTPTGWKVCQEHPKKLEYPCLDCTKMDCDAAKCTEKHSEAVALSIANAVDVREEDQKIIWVAYLNIKPDPNHVYALPELEMEIEERYLPQGLNFQDEPNFHSTGKLAHVFRKKEERVAEEPKGYIKAQEAADRREQVTQILEAHYGNGKAIHKAVHEIDRFYIDMPKEEPKMEVEEAMYMKGYYTKAQLRSFCEFPPPDTEESQEELWNALLKLIYARVSSHWTLQQQVTSIITESKFHLTRVKAELKGEKK